MSEVCSNPPCAKVGPFRYCPVKGCEWMEDAAPKPTLRAFELHRDADVSGVSGTGIVAGGVQFPDGVVALRWYSAWPTSVVFHDKGIESVEAVHGHDGRTRIVWL